VLEIRTGLELLSPSSRQRHLEAAFDRVLDEDLDRRVLAFDVAAAHVAGELVARNRQAGKSVEVRDAQIAGIPLARKAPVATHNIRHFKDLAVHLVDPWGPAGRPKQ
jgi:predicted nucleic acid-binding protein